MSPCFPGSTLPHTRSEDEPTWGKLIVADAGPYREERLARFENILETVGNTPVVKIGKLAPPGVNLYVKIEAFNPLGSVKDRLALGVIEEAERTGKLKPGQTVIEATSGNTGIGLAMVCAPEGLSAGCHDGRNHSASSGAG